MPYLDPTSRDVYYRTWDVPSPVAVAVLVPGFAENTDFYHRLALSLAARSIETWAVDLPGHGRSGGERGIVPLEAGIEAVAGVWSRARAARPADRMVAIGASLGSTVLGAAVVRGRIRPDALLLSAAPLDGIAGPAPELPVPASDPFYLDQLASDPFEFPLGPVVPAAAATIAAGVAELGPNLSGLTIPVALLSGEIDPICGEAVVNRWLPRLQRGSARIVRGDRHDVLNDTHHRETEQAVAEFVLTGRLPA